MRHGSTLALLAAGWLFVLFAPALAGPGAAESWVLPDESQGRRVTPILLLSRPDVQAELRLKPEQVADAARVIADLHHKAASLRGRTDAAAIELRRTVDEEQRLWLETKLTEDQVGRLAEIDLRWEGVAAIVGRPNVAETLSLSDDQRAALTRAVAARNAQLDRPADRQRDLAAAERHLQRQVRATLSDGQRKRWEGMIGRAFTVTPTTTASTAARAAR